MSAQFGGTPIGGMQYNGVTIGEAMMNGVVVYRSVIRVTPAAPTFLTAAPWVTLPTQAGVTYTMSGTPGAGQSVTVTATAQAGYELVGTASWTHTYPSAYPKSGAWGPRTSSATGNYTVASHLIVEEGLYAIEHSAVHISGSYLPAATISGPWGETSATAGATSIASTIQFLSVGDVVNFVLRAIATSSRHVTHSGTWSIVRN